MEGQKEYTQVNKQKDDWMDEWKKRMKKGRKEGMDQRREVLGKGERGRKEDI